MDVSVLISWKTITRPAAWSMGACHSCKGFEAVRIEDAIQVVSIWFVPISRTVVGQRARCDFCERPIDSLLTTNRVELAAWEPAQGIESLVRQLGGDPSVLPAVRDQEIRLLSLLSAVENASSLHRLDTSFGITTGVLLGGIAGALVGYYLLPARPGGLDQFGRVFAGLFGGIVTGAVGGAAIYAFLRQRTLPLRQLKSAHDRYGLDLHSINQLAGTFGRRVGSAARRLRDKIDLARRCPS